MKISTKGRYALRMLLDLAEHQSEGYIALKDIAARQDVSKKYLEQIILIHVTKDDLGLWSDSIYVYYANKSDSKFIEDDIVAIYGEASGEESYTSVLGQNITIPAITAAYMELEK